MITDIKLLQFAIEIARQARDRGNHPFGAVLAIDDHILLSAENTVNTEFNPIGHAETNLVIRAIRELSPEQLEQATLYTSCEPCAMCSGAIYWSGIRRVVYGLAAEELATLAGGDFLIPCRELFSRAADQVELIGPLLSEESRSVQEGFWSK